MKIKKFCIALCLLSAFALWTLLLCTVDVQAVGPEGSKLGMAGINSSFHKLTGVHMGLYILTDILSLIPFGFMLGFALLGLGQLLKGKSLLKVERSILALGVFYAVVMAAYLAFEVWVVNYRPVLIDGMLEASYPSSTTLLVLCVMPTAMMQLESRVKNVRLRKYASYMITAFSVFMVMCRLFSGVHWLIDIIGGVLLSGGLVLLYAAFENNM